jgi:hypothetical protein
MSPAIGLCMFKRLWRSGEYREPLGHGGGRPPVQAPNSDNMKGKMTPTALANTCKHSSDAGNT